MVKELTDGQLAVQAHSIVSELVRRNRVLMATDAGWCREFLLSTVS